MTTMEHFRKIATAIDQRVAQLAATGVSGGELLYRMVGHLPDLHRIWVGASDRQLAVLCHDYPGFYKYASLMEEAAEAQRANPKQSRYKDWQPLQEPLRSKFSKLLLF